MNNSVSLIKWQWGFSLVALCESVNSTFQLALDSIKADALNITIATKVEQNLNADNYLES